MAATTNTATPFMGSVTATTTAQTVFSLLSAVRSQLQHKCAYIQIQLDTTAAGSLYIGDSDVASTNCGVNLSANQANQQFASDSNLIVLDNIYLRASAATQQVNIVVVTR
jgi:hypothetical protein